MSVNINFPNFIEVNALDTSDATATESDIAVGKTAYVNGVKVIGTKDWVDTSDATATASDIAVGKTAYVNDVKVTGTKEDAVQDIVWVDNVSGDLTYVKSSSGVYCPNIFVYIKEITIPNGITGITGNTFRDCKSLESITIPNTVTSIGKWAFKYCHNLAHIYYKGTEEQWNAISKTSEWNDSMGTSVSGGTVIHYNS